MLLSGNFYRSFWSIFPKFIVLNVYFRYITELVDDLHCIDAGYYLIFSMFSWSLP